MAAEVLLTARKAVAAAGAGSKTPGSALPARTPGGGRLPSKTPGSGEVACFALDQHSVSDW